MDGPAITEAPPPRRLAQPALALVLALSTLGAHASYAQQATPTTDLGVFVHQRIAPPLPPLPVAGATVCVTPDLSEPAFWGRWTRSDSPFPYSGVPGLYVMQDIPAPPGMISSTVFVTVARQGDVTVVDPAPLTSFLPTPGPIPGSFTVRFIELQPGGQSNGDCGTPPQDPLGPAVAIRIIPQNATAHVGDLVTFKLEWSAYAFAAPWYLYEWVLRRSEHRDADKPVSGDGCHARATRPAVGRDLMAEMSSYFVASCRATLFRCPSRSAPDCTTERPARRRT